MYRPLMIFSLALLLQSFSQKGKSTRRRPLQTQSRLSSCMFVCENLHGVAGSVIHTETTTSMNYTGSYRRLGFYSSPPKKKSPQKISQMTEFKVLEWVPVTTGTLQSAWAGWHVKEKRFFPGAEYQLMPSRLDFMPNYNYFKIQLKG